MYYKYANIDSHIRIIKLIIESVLNFDNEYNIILTSLVEFKILVEISKEVYFCTI